MGALFRTTAALTIGALFSASAASAAPQEKALQPASKWQMDYTPTECRLLRTFAGGDERITIQFSQVDPDPFIAVSLVTDGVPATDEPKPGRFSTSTVESVEASAQGFRSQGASPDTLQIRPNDRLRPAIERDIAADKPTRLGVDFVRGWDVALDLGPMQASLAAFDECVNDLVRSWGLDPAEQRARRSGPVPVASPANWLRPEDYPLELGRAGAGGIVLVRLSVGADGAPTSCSVAKAGGDKAFEDHSCRLLSERARFTPAVGADGRPIASYWTQRIRWEPGQRFVQRKM